VRLGDGSKRHEFPTTGVSKADVEMNFFLLYSGIQTVQICELRHITLNAGNVASDWLHRCIEFVPSPLADKYGGAFGDEPPSGGQGGTLGASASGCDFCPSLATMLLLAAFILSLLSGRPLISQRRPPAITRVSPVIQAASEEAKKTAAGATSSG
jgi:hypothetical protein